MGVNNKKKNEKVIIQKCFFCEKCRYVTYYWKDHKCPYCGGKIQPSFLSGSEQEWEEAHKMAVNCRYDPEKYY